MKLDSVLALKQSLVAEALVEPTAVMMRAAGEGSRPRAPVAPPAQGLCELDTQPTLALGVAPAKRGEFSLAVRIQQRAMEGSRQVELITRRARGEVDVRYVGRAVKRAKAPPWRRGRCRPLRIGCSVGHVNVTAGTLGAFVRGLGSGRECILSNNHVLANENRCRKGDAVLQPGRFDGGTAPADRVAVLGGFVRLYRGRRNVVDAAAAELLEGVTADWAKLTGLGSLAGVGDVVADVGAEVAKIGRTTGLTRGRVTAFAMDNVVVDYDMGRLRFDDQIEIEGSGDGPFSDGGDSGALIVDGERRAVGLLFAGTDSGGADGKGLTYANPIHTVLSTMKVELVLRPK